MMAPIAGAAMERMLRESAEQRVPLLEALLAHRLADDARRRGAGERSSDAEHRLQQADVPDVGGAGEQEHRRDDLRRALDEVAADQDHAARQPVGEDAAEEEEDHHRDLAREQHDPEVGGAAEVEHREGERDDRHAGAERRHRDRRQVAGEAPLVENLE